MLAGRERFWDVIKQLPRDRDLEQADLLRPELLVAEEDDLRIYYAPLDWFNHDAKVALVGLTPGWQQMQIAYRAAVRDTKEGKSASEACRLAKTDCAFAGSMRANLIKMLDEVGLPSLLGIHRAEDLFGINRSLIHTTSVIRYPVFKGSENYSGHSPRATKSRLLQVCARQWLLEDVEALRQVPVIPLGQIAEEMLVLLANDLGISKNVIRGFPHPSGGNGHRKSQFEENKASIARQLEDVLGDPSIRRR